MDRSEAFAARLEGWICRHRPDKSPLYESTVAPGSIHIVEDEPGGRADVAYVVPEGCSAVRFWPDGMFSFLKEDKTADGALLVCRDDGGYEALIIECKRTVDQKRWHDIARQFR